MASTSSPPSTTSSTSPPPTNSSLSRTTPPFGRQTPSSPPSASKRFLQTLRIPSFYSGVGGKGVGSDRSTSAFAAGGRGGDDGRIETPLGGRAAGTGGVGMPRSLSDGQYPIRIGKEPFEVSSISSPTSSHQLNGGQQLPRLSPLSLDSFGTTATTTSAVMMVSQSLPVINTNARIEIEGLQRDSEEAEEVVETIRAPSRLGGNVEESSSHTTSYRPTPSSFMTIASSQSKRGSILDRTWSEKSGAGSRVNNAVTNGMVGVSGGGFGKRNGAWIVSVNLEPGKKGEKEDGKIEWGKRSVVIYASTPTHQLTFIRSVKEVVALHDKLCRDRNLILPPLPAAILTDKSSSPTKKPRQPSFLSNFQSRFRSTLKVDSKGSRKTSIGSLFKNEISSPPSSPPGHIGGPSPIHPIGAFDFEMPKGEISMLDLGPSLSLLASSSGNGVANGTTVSLLPEISQADAFALVSAMANDKMAADKAAGPPPDLVAIAKSLTQPTNDDLARARHDVVTSLSAYLSTLANDPYVRQTSAWTKFTRIHRNDLASAHTAERSGEEWVEVENSGDEAMLKRTASGNKTAKRKSALRKSKSFTGGMLLVQSWRKSSVNVDGWMSAATSEEAPRRASPEQEKDEVIRIERDAPAPEFKEPPPAEKVATVPSIPSADSGVGIGGISHDTVPGPVDSLVGPPAPDSTSEVIDDKKTTIESAPPNPPTDSEPEATFVDSPDDPQATVRKRAKRGRSGSKVTVEDFELIRVLGKGCAGKVVLVKHKTLGGLFAMKAIIKRHVIAHSELQHTLTEQSVLKRLAKERQGDPTRNAFIVKLWWSFHDADNLYLILDFHPGGDLATQLARWGRLGKDRARFNTAEIVDGVECLHAAGVIYRDLKPENALLGADGHIVLVDFGLAAEFPHSEGPLPALPHWMAGASSDDETRPRLHRHVTTGKDVVVAKRDIATSFVGTAEYLAPEVIKGLPYSYEVDCWSLGTMLYEALLGSTPFWVDNHAEMYMRVVHEELTFPDDRALDKDTKSFIRGLLQKDPAFRLCEPRIKKHPYLSMVDFDHVRHKRYIPPYVPPMDESLEYDIQNFDDAFLAMEPTVKEDAIADDETVAESETSGKVEPISPDAFDGYTFKDRDLVSVLVEGDEEEETRESIDQLVEKEVGEATVVGKETREAIVVEETVTPMAPTPAKTITPSETTPQRTIPPATSLPINLNRSSIRHSRHSHELSGIEALDRDYQLNRSTSNATTTASEDVDADVDADVEDGWDIVDQDQQVAANGRKAKDTFFARGVVDRYKLAVLKRRESTVRKASSSRLRRSSGTAFDEGTGRGPSSLGNLKSRFRVRTKASKAVLPLVSKSESLIRSNSTSRSRDGNLATGRQGSSSESPGASQHSLATTGTSEPSTTPEEKEVPPVPSQRVTSLEGTTNGG